MADLRGKYYSFVTGSLAENDDLVEIAKDKLGRTEGIVPKKLTLISSGCLALDINGLGVDSELFADTDSLWKLSLDRNDVEIKSLIVSASSPCPVFVALIF